MPTILARLLENQQDLWYVCVSFLSLGDNVSLARTNCALRSKYTDAASCARILESLRFGTPAETCFIDERTKKTRVMPPPYKQLVVMVNHLNKCFACKLFESSCRYGTGAFAISSDMLMAADGIYH